MRMEAARMRKGMLLCAGMLALPCALGLHAGGAVAGMAAWMAVIRFLPDADYSYPRKRRGHFTRLFFAWAAFSFLLAAGILAADFFGNHFQSFAFAPSLLRFSAPFPAAVLGERALRIRLSRKALAAGGTLLFFGFLLLLFIGGRQ